jgi:hypothetical protein
MLKYKIREINIDIKSKGKNTKKNKTLLKWIVNPEKIKAGLN